MQLKDGKGAIGLLVDVEDDEGTYGNCKVYFGVADKTVALKNVQFDELEIVNGRETVSS